jgi:cytochrome c biogenesis protein CcmG, thiol:disulfide interchange protein DsbE
VIEPLGRGWGAPAALACALLLAAARPFGAAGASIAQVGQAAPSFYVDTLDGSSVTSDFHGKPAYINVFATWCPPCRSEIPRIVQTSKQYQGRIDFVFVDEQEVPSRVKAFTQQFGMLAPIGIDQGQFAATYGVGALPVSIFIDRQGVVSFIYRGPIPQNVLDDELSKLAGAN